MSKYSKTFLTTRPIMLFIFNYSCQMCGISQSGNHIHHIDFDKKNNDLLNFTCLCSDCHKITHKAHIIHIVEFNYFQLKMLARLRFALYRDK